ncbi:hypothetical protein F4777DRAFT_539480 [Nemania sp. FL0916]|nr:hypothetical protein F4777DRAFT_539480 [Nemania sp. FL0916]
MVWGVSSMAIDLSSEMASPAAGASSAVTSSAVVAAASIEGAVSTTVSLSPETISSAGAASSVGISFSTGTVSVLVGVSSETGCSSIDGSPGAGASTETVVPSGARSSTGLFVCASSEVGTGASSIALSAVLSSTTVEPKIDALCAASSFAIAAFVPDSALLAGSSTTFLPSAVSSLGPLAESSSTGAS